jgi:hypothetical protein
MYRPRPGAHCHVVPPYAVIGTPAWDRGSLEAVVEYETNVTSQLILQRSRGLLLRKLPIPYGFGSPSDTFTRSIGRLTADRYKTRCFTNQACVKARSCRTVLAMHDSATSAAGPSIPVAMTSDSQSEVWRLYRWIWTQGVVCHA